VLSAALPFEVHVQRSGCSCSGWGRRLGIWSGGRGLILNGTRGALIDALNNQI